ncbi:uncharacterized protein LOC132549982 [Ylistrum balloti]|uniref:uncharacterized protein LOC132549982 n=1 Tax=Ylistrum balloti TaxID=509963 RepID=UPI0029059B4C|nr:uncharacterized protein LOC132549982 [Ylistrum balloti]
MSSIIFQITITVVCTAGLISTAPMMSKCTPCAIYCSDPDVTGPSCWSCQCEPDINSSYQPPKTSCNNESCRLKCSKHGLKVDIQGCPNCQCRMVSRIDVPS